MTFGIFSYLITILLFGGSAIIIELILGGMYEIRHYKRVMQTMLLFGLIYVILGESTALSWQAWIYSSYNTLGIHIAGAEIETYFYMIFCIIATSIATLFFADVEEKHGSFRKASSKKVTETVRFLEKL